MDSAGIRGGRKATIGAALHKLKHLLCEMELGAAWRRALSYDIERSKPQVDLQTNPSHEMGNRCAKSLTTMEMLDAVEAGIAILRSRGTPGEAPLGAGAGTAVNLRAELQAAGVSVSELARAMNVSRQELEAWAAGASPAPEWVPAAIQLVAALSPSERRKLLYGRTGYGPSGGRARPDNRHPFSRIEEL